MRVGLCDSGLGGIAILNEVRKRYLNNDYVYIGDNKNLPYGNKSKKELIDLCQNMIAFLEEKNVDIIIVACGTLSSNVMNDIKSNVKILDILTPTIDYINNVVKKEVTVFATNATINTHIFKKNLKYGALEIACPEFVPMIEENKIDKAVIKSKIPNDNIIVLGCTHYGLIENVIPNKCINMGKIIELPENKGKGTVDIYFTDKLKVDIKNIIEGEVKYARITRGGNCKGNIKEKNIKTKNC